MPALYTAPDAVAVTFLEYATDIALFVSGCDGPESVLTLVTGL